MRWNKIGFAGWTIGLRSIPFLVKGQTLSYASDSFWLWSFLGRLHPMIVHFPLSLLVLAAVLEMISVQNYQSKWRLVIRTLLWVGCLSALISAGAGYLLMIHDQYEGNGVELHRNLGIATALLSIVCLYLSGPEGAPLSRSRILAYRSTLLVTTLVLVLTGHYGASL